MRRKIVKNKVSIIIPFRNQVKLLKKCVLSVLEKTDGVKYEIILVDNQSTQKRIQNFLTEITQQNYQKVSVLQFDKPFNFSAINNFAVEKAKGEFILFLNNDTEVITQNWLKSMLELFNNSRIGVVGAKLLYPNNTIQHAGIEFRDGMPINAFGKIQDSGEKGAPFNKVHECLAVTAACMMTRKKLFQKVGGFDEINLPIAYNDVDYCFTVREAGLKVIYQPKARLYHHESASRGKDILKRFFNRKRYKEFLQELSYLRNKWKKCFK